MTVSLMLVASMLLAQAGSQNGKPASTPPEAGQIVQLVNQARAEVGAAPLQWDKALADAARQHCLRIVSEDSVEHQYEGEPALTDRADHAGAHFSLIAESVAVGSAPADIHDGWMRSPEDRTARAVCVTDKPLSRGEAGRHPGFVLRWQDSDTTRLPQALMERIHTPQYSQAAVGSCPAQDVKGAFTAYRVAVLLY